MWSNIRAVNILLIFLNIRKKGPFSTKSILETQEHDEIKLAFCKEHGIQLICIDHPQTASKFDKPSFIADLVKRVLDKELKVS